MERYNGNLKIHNWMKCPCIYRFSLIIKTLLYTDLQLKSHQVIMWFFFWRVFCLCLSLVPFCTWSSWWCGHSCCWQTLYWTSGLSTSGHSGSSSGASTTPFDIRGWWVAFCPYYCVCSRKQGSASGNLVWQRNVLKNTLILTHKSSGSHTTKLCIKWRFKKLFLYSHCMFGKYHMNIFA